MKQKLKMRFEIIHAVLFDERGLDAGCHFKPGRFGPGRFGPGNFEIHVMYLDYHDDLLKNRKRFNYHIDVSD